MADKAWKQAERDAATIIDGARKWANSGQEIDVESAWAVAQVKHVQRCPLPEVERLALEAERQGAQRQKVGLVMLKRKQHGGPGRETPWLIVMTEAAFREMNGRLPTEDPRAELGPSGTRRDT